MNLSKRVSMNKKKRIINQNKSKSISLNLKRNRILKDLFNDDLFKKRKILRLEIKSEFEKSFMVYSVCENYFNDCNININFLNKSIINQCKVNMLEVINNDFYKENISLNLFNIIRSELFGLEEKEDYFKKIFYKYSQYINLLHKNKYVFSFDEINENLSKVILFEELNDEGKSYLKKLMLFTRKKLNINKFFDKRYLLSIIDFKCSLNEDDTKKLIIDFLNNMNKKEKLSIFNFYINSQNEKQYKYKFEISENLGNKINNEFTKFIIIRLVYVYISKEINNINKINSEDLNNILYLINIYENYNEIFSFKIMKDNENIPFNFKRINKNEKKSFSFSDNLISCDIVDLPKNIYNANNNEKSIVKI